MQRNEKIKYLSVHTYPALGCKGIQQSVPQKIYTEIHEVEHFYWHLDIKEETNFHKYKELHVPTKSIIPHAISWTKILMLFLFEKSKRKEENCLRGVIQKSIVKQTQNEGYKSSRALEVPVSVTQKLMKRFEGLGTDANLTGPR